MRISIRRIAAVAAAATFGLAASATWTPLAQADGSEVTVGLHNTTAGSAECPAQVIGAAWHFVAPPKSATDFVHITLVLDGNTVVIPDESWISDPLQGDAYVLVPAGYTLGSLQGGTFVITGSDKDVRLSHTCGGDIPPPPGPPEVQVTKTADVTYIDEYNWTVDKRVVSVVPHTMSADITYAIDVARLGPYPVAGSYEVTGAITIENLDTKQVADITALTDGLTTATASCTLDPAFSEELLIPGESVTYDYTCTGIAGLPTGTDTNTATATLHHGQQDIPIIGTAVVDWASATVRDTLDETATLTDSQMPGMTWYFSGSGSVSYTKADVPAGGTSCTPGLTNTATLVEDDTQVIHTDSVSVKLCTTTGGHTIGYWFASPAGNAATLAAFGELKAAYPNVLGSLTLDTSRKIKNFGSAANCSGDCASMLQAQFIATTMSKYTTPSYGAQMVYVDSLGWISISNLLSYIDSHWSTFTTPERIMFKNVLDAINNDKALTLVIIT